VAAAFASGRIVDVILALVVAEALAILLWRRLTGRGPALADLAATLLSGALLMLALRSALHGSDWPTIAGFLAASLAAHLVDLGRRWRAHV
jgi:hypothetical protein